jgi:hypothetical protein
MLYIDLGGSPAAAMGAVRPGSQYNGMTYYPLMNAPAFLRERYGIFTGPREYWHDSRLTPDRADLRDFLRACRRARGAGNRKHAA